MDLLPPEIICHINDFIPIIDQIHFSQINKFNYHYIKINKDLPHLLISKFKGDMSWYGEGYKLSVYIRLDQLKSYLDKLEKEFFQLKQNPPQGYRVALYTEIYIIILINGKPIDERKTDDVYLLMDIGGLPTINYYEHKDFPTLIRNLINMYENKQKAPDLPLIQDYK